MKETQLSSVLVKHMRTTMPGAVIWKLQDKFAGGRPDILVIWRGRVAAIEVKLDRAGRLGQRTELQRLTLQRLQAAGALAVWLVYWPDGAVIEAPDTQALASWRTPRAPHREVAAWVAKALESR